jgi:hypothetical protein
MTLFEAKPYDPRQGRKKRNIIIAIVFAVLVMALVWWQLRFWPEERVVDRFFDALQQQHFDQAYGIWMNDPDWKQHPDRYSRYTLNDFTKDWGPSGEWGIIKSHKIYAVGYPPRGPGSPAFGSPSGVVVIVTVNDRIAHKASLWIQKDDKTLGFSPYVPPE